MRRLTSIFILIALLLIPSICYAPVSGAPGFQLQDEGVNKGQVTKLNAVGAGVTATKSGSTGVLTINGDLLYLKLDQTTPQRVINGTPIFGQNLDVYGSVSEWTKWEDNANPFWFDIGKSRGTEASPTTVLTGDQLGMIEFWGYTSQWELGAQIYGIVNGVIGTGDFPTDLVFTTTPDGSDTPVERWRITSAGILQANGAMGLLTTGVVDFGGATSLEMPNTAGDVTLTTGGMFATDTTNKQFGIHDGTQEVAIPLRHVLQGTLDLASAWDLDSDVWILDLHADTFPNGIYITAVYVDCSVADPTTELDANLMYCDAVAGGAFPGANATLIKAIDTTTGNFSDAAVNTAVATGKSLYLDIDADPVDANTVYHVRVHYRIPES